MSRSRLCVAVIIILARAACAPGMRMRAGKEVDLPAQTWKAKAGENAKTKTMESTAGVLAFQPQHAYPASQLDTVLVHEVPTHMEAARFESLLYCTLTSLAVCFLLALLWSVNSEGDSSETFKVVFLCVATCPLSVGLHVLNKALVDHLQAPALILTLQMVSTFLLIGLRSWRDVFSAPRGQVLKWLVVPLVYAGMLNSYFRAYADISLMLLSLVQSLIPLLTLPLESLIMERHKQPAITWEVVLGLVTMLVGTMLYSEGNIDTISMGGVGFALLGVAFNVADRLLQRRLLTSECNALSTGACAMLNNGIGALVTLVFAFAAGEAQTVVVPQHRDRWLEPQVMALLPLVAIVKASKSIVDIECRRAISATAFGVLVNVAKVGLVCAGIVFFADPIGSDFAGIGLAMSLGGGFLYSWAQNVAVGKSKNPQEAQAVKGKA